MPVGLTRQVEMETTCPALALADSDTPSEDERASENTPLDPSAANTSSEDTRQEHSPVRSQPVGTLASGKHKGEEPAAGLDDYSRRTCSEYPSDARFESSDEYLDEQFVVEQGAQVPKVEETNHEPSPDSPVPEEPTPSQAEQLPSSAFRNPNRPLRAVDRRPSSGLHRRNNPDPLPSLETRSWEEPFQASSRSVPFLHIRHHNPWPERPSSEPAANTAVPLVFAEVDRPSWAGTENHKDPMRAEKSPVPERGETDPAADRPEHMEHMAA